MAASRLVGLLTLPALRVSELSLSMYEASASVVGRGFDSRHVHQRGSAVQVSSAMPESTLSLFGGRDKASTAAMKVKWTCRGRMAPR
jgi:hypothetical protein